jgi:hypothetical protein
MQPKDLTDWHEGTIDECPICGNKDLEFEDMLGFRPGGSAFVSRCTSCEQRVHIAEFLSHKKEFISRWSLIEPISTQLHKAGEIPGEIAELVRTDLLLVNEELISYLAKHPEMMYDVSPRKFEELVAELLYRMGYDVELTPYSKDGGYDILAIWRGEVGSLLTLVECKRYRLDRPVGVEHVRNLIGVWDSVRASHAMIATTSSFTSGARDLERKYKWQLSLHDYGTLHSWLQKYHIGERGKRQEKRGAER